jgi:hypothetical protein
MLAAAILHLLCLKQETLPRQVVDSGRCVNVAESPDSRVSSRRQIAPGQPPILIFRFYEGKLHHRFGNDDLVLDDAGH